MSTVYRDAIRAFLTEHAKDPSRIPATMELLEPFFVHAESGTYPLANASDLDPEAVRTAIATVTGRTATRVVFISADTQGPVDWVTEDAYEEKYGDGNGPWFDLAFNLWFDYGGTVPFGDNLCERFDSEFRVGIPENHQYYLRRSLVGGLWASFGAGLEASHGANLKVDPEKNPEESNYAWVSLEDEGKPDQWMLVTVDREYGPTDTFGDSIEVNLSWSLFYFLGFIILGDTEIIDRLIPLIQLLPKAIPLGEAEEPGTWFVLVA